jgi:hypothetical protein
MSPFRSKHGGRQNGQRPSVSIRDHLDLNCTVSGGSSGGSARGATKDRQLTCSHDYEDAAKAGNRCRAKGVLVSIMDILLCAVGMKRDWATFTTDPDFSNYAKVLPFSIHAPRG